MPLPTALARAKIAIHTWNKQFLREHAPLVLHQNASSMPPPTPEKLSDVLKTGAVTGGLAGIAMIGAGVALYGTATPVALFFGGILISGMTALTFAYVAPILAVVIGAPIAGIAGLLGAKQPVFPSFPKITAPKVDFQAAGKTIEQWGDRLRHKFSKSSTKQETPAAAPETPPHLPDLPRL